MYYVVVYDIASNKRLAKALKVCRKYLMWVQRSVFEGELTNHQFTAFRKELKSVINSQKDNVIFFSIRNRDVFKRETIGKDLNAPTNFI